MRRIVIVGAGIGGLCAARAVALAGDEPVLLERSSGDSAVGAGLLLWPNAVRALDALGLGAAVRGVGEPVNRTTIRDATGRPLWETDIAALTRRAGAPMLAVERPALHEALGEDLAVRLNATVTGVDDGGAVLASGEHLDADAVIGADGIGSVVREYVCPGTRPIDTGHTVVRGIAEHDIGPGEAFEAWGRGELVGGVALCAERSYWFFEAESEAVEGRDPVEAVRAGRWPDPFPAQVAATRPDRMLVNRILRLDSLARWTRGAVALLGDAAHGMEPNLGQGAAQAIEDAEALRAALRANADLPGALAQYAMGRRRRAHMFQHESTRFARFALSRHEGPRNLIARLIPGPVRDRSIEYVMNRHAPRPPAIHLPHGSDRSISTG